MRLRSWLVVGITAVLLVAVGAVGILVNRSALRAVESVHRTDSLALSSANAALAGQLLTTSVNELNDFAVARTLNLRPEDADDRRVLGEYSARSGFFSYAVTVTDVGGTLLNSTRAAAELPLANDPGYAPMRESLGNGRPGLSSLMSVGATTLYAVAVPLISGGSPAGVLTGYVPAVQSQLQQNLVRLRTPSHLSMVVDSGGLVVAASHPQRLGTRVDPAILAKIRATSAQFVKYRADGQSMVALVTGGMPGGWAYVRVQSTAVFDDPVRDRSLTIDLALLSMLLVGVVGLAVLGHRLRLVRRHAEAVESVEVDGHDGRIVAGVEPGGVGVVPGGAEVGSGGVGVVPGGVGVEPGGVGVGSGGAGPDEAVRAGDTSMFAAKRAPSRPGRHRAE